MNINTRNMAFVNYNGQEMQWVKFNGVTVYESWRDLIVSGVPPLTLTKCKGVDLIDYKMYGNSVQDKNLFDYYNRNVVTGYFSTNGAFSTAVTTKSVVVECQPNTTYEVSKVLSARFAIGFSTEIPTSNTHISNVVTGNSATTLKGTSLEDSKYLVIWLYHSSYDTMTVEDIVKTLKVCYVPTPDKPVEIESVGEQTINLFNLQEVNFIGEPIVVSKTIDKIVFDNSSSNFANYCSTPNVLFDLKPNTTYSTRVKIIEEIIEEGGINSGTMNKSILLQDSAGWVNVERYYIVQGFQAPTTIKDDNGYYYTTFTTPEDMKNLKYITTRLTGYTKLTFQELMIVEGEYGKDNFPNYVTYGYKIPVVSKGQNYFNPYWIPEEKLYGVTAEINGDNITLNGLLDDRRYSSSKSLTYIEGGRYTFTTNIIGGELENNLRLGLYKSNDKGNYLGSYGLFAIVNTEKKSDIQILDIEAGYYLVYIAYSGSAEPVFKNTTFNVRMEKDTPITTYIHLNEPLRKFGEYADYIDFKNKKVVRNIGQVTYNANGGEVWGYAGAYNGYFVANTLLEDNALVLCNLAPSALENSTTIISIRKNYNAVRFQAIATLYDTLESFLQFLSNNNMQVIGKLITPTEETIELPNIPTLKGTSVLEVDTTIQPSNLEVVYKGKGK